MSFVDQEDILNTFEGLTRHLLKEVKGIELNEFPRITYDEAYEDVRFRQIDIRFGMKFVELNDICKEKIFRYLMSAELVVGINVKGGANFKVEKN